MKSQLLYLGVLALLIAAWTTGCGGEPTAVAPDGELSATQSADSVELRESEDSTIALEPTSEEATMTPVLNPEPAGATPPPEAEQVVRLANEDLAERLGLSTEDIRVVSVEAMNWRDSSLGCPQPGMMYAQVITPGFLVVLEAEGQEYEYHTDQGRFAVLCEEGSQTSGATSGATAQSETGIPEPQDPFLSDMVTRAREDLAGQLSVDTGQITLFEIRRVTWPDSSLGCPQPGVDYAEEPQEGLLIRLGVEKDMYFYHSGETGDPFLCEDTSQVIPKVTPKSDEFVPPPDSEID